MGAENYKNEFGFSDSFERISFGFFYQLIDTSKYLFVRSLPEKIIFPGMV